MKSTRAIAGAALIVAALLPRPARAAAPVPPTGTRDGEVFLSGILESLRGLDPTAPSAGPKDRNEAFDLILGRREYPGSCATPLVLALVQASPGLPVPARALVASLGPGAEASPLDRSFLFDSGASSFRVHFTTDPSDPGALRPDDDDLDGVPDEARRIADRLFDARAAVDRIFEMEGMPLVPTDAAGRAHDVDIADLPRGVAAWIYPARSGLVLVLDRDSALSPAGPEILRHQMAHLYEMSLTVDESPWWYEAHAAWALDPEGLRAPRSSASIAAYLRSSGEGFEPDRVASWEGALLWPHFLVASGGSARLLSAAWEEMAAVPGNNTVSAFERALMKNRGMHLSTAVRSFRIWNLFTGDADDGNHYPFGSELPSMPLPSVRELSEALRAAGRLPSLGGFATRLVAGSGPGGWGLDFSGTPGVAWDLSIVTIPARLDAGPRLAELVVDTDGHGGAAVPWGDLAAVVIVVQNLGDGSREVPRYSLEAKYDPLVPFDLMSFTADADEGGVALRWTTERERDLAGWKIYRSQNPVSGFAPITTLQLPASGETGAASYLFLDSEARAGRKYYYFLEGITWEGFTERSYTSAARIPPQP